MRQLDFRDRFSRHAWQAGADYVELGAVTDRRRLHVQLTARVSGRRDDYRIAIDLDRATLTCSCGKESCRHVAAALQAYGAEPDSFFDLTPARDALLRNMPAALLNNILLGADLGEAVMQGAADLWPETASIQDLTQGLQTAKNSVTRGQLWLALIDRLAHTDVSDAVLKAAQDALGLELALDPWQLAERYLHATPAATPLLEQALLRVTAAEDRQRLALFCLGRELSERALQAADATPNASWRAERAMHLAGVLLYTLGELDAAALTPSAAQHLRIEKLKASGHLRLALWLALLHGDDGNAQLVFDLARETEPALAAAMSPKMIPQNPNLWRQVRALGEDLWQEWRHDIVDALKACGAHAQLAELLLEEGKIDAVTQLAQVHPLPEDVLLRLLRNTSSLTLTQRLEIMRQALDQARETPAAARWQRRLDRLLRQLRLEFQHPRL